MSKPPFCRPEQPEWPAATLTLSLLASREKIALIESLPGPDAPGISEREVLPPSVLSGQAHLLREAAELETLGLIEHVGESLRRSSAADDLNLVRTLLQEWGWGARRSDSEAAELPATPDLAAMVHQIWAAGILISLAIQAAGVGELTTSLAGPSLSTVKRHVSTAQNAGLLAKGIFPGKGRQHYSLTRRACLLIRPLCAALRLEERHLGDFALPPTLEVLRAGMAVNAQLLTPDPEIDRDILFEVLDDKGLPIVIKRARYRDGRLVDMRPSPHFSDLICISGTMSAWYALIIDLDPGAMLAHNRGAKTILRQLRRDLRDGNGSSLMSHLTT